MSKPMHMYLAATALLWLAPFFFGASIQWLLMPDCTDVGGGPGGCILFGRDVSGDLYDAWILWSFFGLPFSALVVTLGFKIIALLRCLRA